MPALPLAALAAALTLALLAPVAPSAIAAPAPVETAAATPRGSTFLLPEGWARHTQDNAVILTPPEAGGSRVAIVDAQADDPDAAVAEAWAVLGLSPKLLVATDSAPRDGWEQRRFYEYDVAANDKRVVYAGAYRRGQAWTVVGVDVDQAIREKRSSQFGKLHQGLHPAGYTPESFAGRTAHKFDQARLQQVATFVEQMRQAYDVPGVAIGIVQDGKVVMSQGFGVRELGKPGPVDGDTRFFVQGHGRWLA